MSLKQSTVVIYKSTGILPERNFNIENIANYLLQFTSTTISNVQYFKHALDTFVKLKYSQELQEFLASNDYNYMSITNDGGKTVYYFIDGKGVLAEDTIRFHIKLDTVNTFLPGTDFTISNKTKIKRQHRDRFVNLGYKVISSDFYGPIYTTELRDDGLYHYTITYTDSLLAGKFFKLYATAYRVIPNTATSYPPVFTWNWLTGEWTMDVKTDNANAYYEVYVDTARVDTADYNVDTYNEGLTPVLFKKSSTMLGQNLTDDVAASWYLIYKTNGTALDCYLLPDNQTTVSIASINFTLTATDLTDDINYYFLGKWYDSPVYFIPGTVGRMGFVNKTSSSEGYLLLTKNGQSITYEVGVLMNDPLNDTLTKYVVKTGIVSTILFPYPPLSLYYYSTSNSLTAQQMADQDVYNGTFSTPGQVTQYDIPAFIALDRTDSTLVKIIKMPYLPTPVDANGVFDSSWGIENNTIISGADVLKLRNINQKFVTSLESTIDSPFKAIKGKTISPTVNSLRTAENEPKLYHSDFYQPKFVYDSFNYAFQLEKEDINKLDSVYDGYLKAKFIMSSAIVSKFAFMFPEVSYKYSTEDFDNVLAIARNNEVALFTSDYLNYIRNGYNYDVKTKRRSEINTIASVAGGIASLAIGAFSKNAATTAIGIISTTTAIIQGANSIAQAEANIQQKLAQSQAQAWSVSSADDIDLLDAYSGNKAYLNIYEVSDRLKSALYDVFFYTGYATDEQGIPDMTSRYRFNFVACDLVVTGNNNIPADIDSDLKARYSEGVTFIHELDGVWDTEQIYENWEKSLGGDS